MTPVEYLLSEGYPLEIAEEIARYLEKGNE